MKINHSDENWSIWWKFIEWGKVISVIKILKRWWKIIELMKNHLCNENLSRWWKLTHLMKYHLLDERVLIWWKFIKKMKIDWFNVNNQFDEYSSLWGKLAHLLMMLWKFTWIHYFNENSLLIWKLITGLL